MLGGAPNFGPLRGCNELIDVGARGGLIADGGLMPVPCAAGSVVALSFTSSSANPARNGVMSLSYISFLSLADLFPREAGAAILWKVVGLGGDFERLTSMLRRSGVPHDYDKTYDWVEVLNVVFVFEGGGKRLIAVVPTTRPPGLQVGDQ